jgi:hypothetical protein
MAKPVPLDNVTHKALRVITTRSAAYGDNVNYALIFPGEFRNIQAAYPIVFHKRSDNGQFQPIALLGFEPGENLFLGDAGWDAGYIPLSIERLPFLIGTQGRSSGDGEPELTIHVDMDSPRVSLAEGEPVFREYGGTTEYLDRMSSLLTELHLGLKETAGFIDALLERDLLESFVLDVELKDGSQHRLGGFYTINEERLRALDAVALGALHARGHLEPTYMVLASLVHLRDLIDRRNRRS